MRAVENSVLEYLRWRTENLLGDSISFAVSIITDAEEALLDAQAALQVRDHEASSIQQQDSSSMVFGIMETTPPSSFDQK